MTDQLRAGLAPLGAVLVACLIGGLPLHAESDKQGPPPLSTLTRVVVSRFVFEGNTAFSNEQLCHVVASYVGREITSLELQEARRAVTLYYVNHGYINSGAVIPDQQVRDGVIIMRVIEGRLAEIAVTGNRWLCDRYIQPRLRLWAGPPLNVNSLQEGLQLLRQNPNVRQVNAELQPGGLPGESRLSVRVLDEQPFRLGIQVDNTRPPSVGAEEVVLLAGDRNLTGHSDPLDLSYGIAHNGSEGFVFSGLNNVSGQYALPLTARDTTLRVYVRKDDFAIIQEPLTRWALPAARRVSAPTSDSRCTARPIANWRWD
jgi:hemolysin activation/secretion protein